MNTRGYVTDEVYFLFSQSQCQASQIANRDAALFALKVRRSHVCTVSSGTHNQDNLDTNFTIRCAAVVYT